MDVIVIRCLAVVCKRVAGCAAGGGPRRLRSTGSTGEVCESVEVILEMDVCKVLLGEPRLCRGLFLCL